MLEIQIIVLITERCKEKKKDEKSMKMLNVAFVKKRIKKKNLWLHEYLVHTRRCAASLGGRLIHTNYTR